MALQRLGGGIAWLALVAVSLYLLEPALFPDIALPAALDGLLGAAHERRLIGVIAGLIALAMGLGGMLEFFRSFRPRRSRPLTFAGPTLGDETPAKRPGPTPVVNPPIRVSPSLKLIEPVKRAAPVTAPRPAAAPAPVPVPLEVVAIPGRKAMLEAMRQGDVARDKGDRETALEHYGRAVEFARGLHGAAPDDLEAKADLATVLSRLAVQEEAQGQIETALSLYEESVELRRSLAAAAPEATESAEALASALAELADCREARGHASRARDHYAEVVGISERLSWLEPESESRRTELARHKARLDALKAELRPSEG